MTDWLDSEDGRAAVAVGASALWGHIIPQDAECRIEDTMDDASVVLAAVLALTKPCPTCGGSGSNPERLTYCRDCGGSGTVPLLVPRETSGRMAQVSERRVSEATIKYEPPSRGCVWGTGDALWWWEPPKRTRRRFVDGARWPDEIGSYHGMLCIAEREVGPKGGVKKGAVTVHIEATTWGAVQAKVRSLGFSAPTLTATSLREKAA